MQILRQSFLALLALILVSAGPVAVHAADPGAAPAAGTSDAVVVQPRTNAEIRQWYNDQVAVIPALNAQWTAEGLTAEQRAQRAHDIRHAARVQARAFMADPSEVTALQARDQEKYGNPDGPTFAYLVQQNRDRGLTGDAVYEAIIGSANRTDRTTNERFGVTPASPPPSTSPPQ